MRILFVVHQYPPEELGGTEIYTQQTSRALVQQGHVAAVFTRSYRTGQGVEATREDGVQVYRAWDGEFGPGRRYLASFFPGSMTESFTRALTEFRPDVVHIQHLMGLPLDILGQLQAAGIPYLITLHDYWWVCANAQLLTNYDHTICRGPRAALNCTRCAVARGGALAAPAAPALWVSLLERNRRLRRGLDAAHTLLVSTTFVAEWYTVHSVQPAKLRVLPPGVDRPAVLPAREAPRPGAPLRVAYVGGLAWQKGVHIVVQAAAALGDQVTLQVAGVAAPDAAYGEQLRGLAGENTHFLGRLAREDVWHLLRQSDVVAVPSLWYETYSYALHEALAVETPVVASDLGVMAGAVEDGVNGLLVAPGDVQAWQETLARLRATPSLLAHLREGIVPPPTKAEVVEQLNDIYRHMCMQPAIKPDGIKL